MRSGKPVSERRADYALAILPQRRNNQLLYAESANEVLTSLNHVPNLPHKPPNILHRAGFPNTAQSGLSGLPDFQGRGSHTRLPHGEIQGQTEREQGATAWRCAGGRGGDARVRRRRFVTVAKVLYNSQSNGGGRVRILQ